MVALFMLEFHGLDGMDLRHRLHSIDGGNSTAKAIDPPLALSGDITKITHDRTDSATVRTPVSELNADGPH
ncbi:hypothetical protein FHS85_002287 [Rhodoligotrophos appendicifer]